ncbi:MAG: anti-sigma F factor [Candidatus Borkfalkiaceae bacterium]|nr:anti-sigma F factor [Christensenellaceae bacterium]
MKNKMYVTFASVSENEGFARNVIASFLLPLNPSVGELSDIKTAVSEAVTNAIVHGYPDTVGDVTMLAETDGEDVHIVVSDNGVGIANLEEALEPFFTSRPEEERSGMGFTIIRTFMDEVKVISKLNEGTIVDMKKTVAG